MRVKCSLSVAHLQQSWRFGNHLQQRDARHPPKLPWRFFTTRKRRSSPEGTHGESLFNLSCLAFAMAPVPRLYVR